jgi:hypothetical protein
LSISFDFSVRHQLLVLNRIYIEQGAFSADFTGALSSLPEKKKSSNPHPRIFRDHRLVKAGAEEAGGVETGTPRQIGLNFHHVGPLNAQEARATKKKSVDPETACRPGKGQKSAGNP